MRAMMIKNCIYMHNESEYDNKVRRFSSLVAVVVMAISNVIIQQYIEHGYCCCYFFSENQC